MNILFVFTDYLSGKSIYPTLRRLLSLLFSLAISAFIFEKVYFKIVLPDITDYRAAINFFLKGYFIVPFCIFLLVHGTTYFVPKIIFSVFNYFQSLKLVRKIIEYEVNKDIERSFGRIRVITKKYTALEVKKEDLINLYMEYKDSINPETLNSIETDCDKQKNIVEDNFIFAFRTIITTIIFFLILPHLGWLLFSITIIALLFYMLLLFIEYHFLNIAPVAVRKFKYEADKYIEGHLEKIKPLPVTT